MIAAQKVTTSCPYCRASVPVEIHSIIDVGQNPDLKGQFLSGRLNSATCPNCRRTFQMGGALLYHDGSKDFLGIFLPHEINLANKDRQRLIGDLNRRLVDSLLPEQRRAYLFQPKEFITLNGMVEAILAADGITPEMQRAQRERMQLLETILRGATSADALQAMAKEYDAKLDLNFFTMLAAMVEQYAAEGDTQSANMFAALYQQILPQTSFGDKARAQQEAVGQINQQTTREQLLNMIVAAEDDQLEAYVMAGRPLIDYGFYQELTGRIETAQAAGDTATAQRLTSLRERILALTAQLDQASRQMLEEASTFLRDLLQAPDPQTLLQENWDRVDDAFMQVLEMNLEAASSAATSSSIAKLSRRSCHLSISKRTGSNSSMPAAVRRARRGQPGAPTAWAARQVTAGSASTTTSRSGATSAWAAVAVSQSKTPGSVRMVRWCGGRSPRFHRRVRRVRCARATPGISGPASCRGRRRR